MITVNVNSRSANELFDAIKRALSPESVDATIARAAARVLREVVERTPKRWFGQVRRSWQMVKGEKPGQWVVRNPHKVMRYLEFGTANEGTGFIYPKRARALYIPLNRKASFGWNADLEYGEDYILRRRVRGIKPRRIVARMRPFVESALLYEMRATIRNAIAGINP